MLPKRSRAALLAALGLSLAAFASCSPALVSGFAWREAAGSSLGFSQSAAFPRGEEGRLGPERPKNRYLLATPFAVPPGQDLELELELREGPSARLALSLSPRTDGSEAFSAAAITLREASTRFVLPLEAGKTIRSLSLELLPSEEGAPLPSLELRGLSFIPAFRGYRRGSEPLRLSSGFSLSLRGQSLRASLAAPFAFAAPGSGSATPPAGEPVLVLSYGPLAAPPRDSALELEAQPGPSFRFRPKASGALLRIPLRAFEREPERLDLELPAGAELGSLYASYLPAAEAGLLDLGAILRARPADPGADFDLYRWDLLPEVLVFDFRDYGVQDLYLKRLAFFVEKEGFKGRLAPDREIASLHGWNAHDYRPEDLAAFFEAARSSAFPLNGEERRLEALLIEAGLLLEGPGGFRPGRGALISISRESAPYLRSTFITHEASHALYFADADFRAFVQAEWARVSAEERWFWKLYFGWMKYDVSNDYLMASEYMAYLFQQPVSKAEEYFTKLLPSRLLEHHEDLEPRIEAYMESFGSRFAERAGRIEAWLFGKYELRAGRAYFLY